METEGKVIEAVDGSKYLVLKEIVVDDIKFALLTNLENQMDSFIAAIEDTRFDKVENPEVKEKILEAIANEE